MEMTLVSKYLMHELAFTKKEVGHYICEIDGYIIEVAKYNQNSYWAWTISTPTGDIITPAGNNHFFTMHDCKIDSLEMLEIVKEA